MAGFVAKDVVVSTLVDYSRVLGIRKCVCNAAGVTVCSRRFQALKCGQRYGWRCDGMEAMKVIESG